METEYNDTSTEPNVFPPGENMIPTGHHEKLTSSEMAQIWGAYQNDTLANCMLQYFLAHVEDPGIRAVIEYGLQLSQAHIDKLTTIFHNEQFPVPYGFKAGEDVDVKAPRLYSDHYMLNYMQQMGKLGINAMSVAVALSTRADLFTYFSECLSEYVELQRKANEVLLAKGLYVRPPYIPIPEKVDFITKQHFMTGWFGDRRPLVSLEIANLFDNILRNALGVATLIGFSQVAQTKRIKDYMVRGKEIAAKHVEIFGSVLREDDLPVPMTWESEVTESTAPTFSDKLIMFHTTSLIAIGMGYYGVSMSTTLRRDISAHYVRLINEIAKYAEDGANIMIDNGWMERPPQAADRDKLLKQ